MTYTWLIIFVILTILELITVNLVSIWFAIGALITAFVSLKIDNTLILLAIFTITSIISLLLTKSIVKRIKTKEVIATNLDQVIGKSGVVTEEIDKLKIGEIKVLGKKWSAVGNKFIPKDSKVKVLAIEGVKLRVEEIKESD